jgi:ATP-dependent DNA helicase RecG
MLTENKTIEFKREYTDEIKRTVTAFANTDGGRIYIGVEDDGSIRGITEIDDVMLRVTNVIRDSIRPDITLFTEIGVEQIDNKSVVVVRIQRGTARPYYLAGKGIRPEGVFVRQGASTVPATDTAILNMIKETSGDCYEDARSLNQQLTFHETAAYFDRKGVALEESQKKTLKLIGEDGMYTNLALLLSEQCTHTIKLAVFEGEKKTIFKERREFSGSVLNQLEEAYAFIDRFNSTRSEFKGLDRIDMRDYPPEAIREALLNAIVHRDYAFSGSTLINIFDNRMEIVTIGGLVKGISLSDIMLGVSILRNQHLANIFYRLKLIEAFGTGMPKIMGCYDDYAIKAQIEATNNAFKITLPNTNSRPAARVSEPAVVVSEREKLVLSLFTNQDFIVRKDVESVAGISQPTAVVLLREMVEKGLLKKVGSGKLVKYKTGEYHGLI